MTTVNGNSSSALEALNRALPGLVECGEAARFGASYDNLKLSILPDAVVRVRTGAEVGTVLKIAHDHDVPVTARGAGSSPTGSAVPLRGGWVLDLSGLNGIKVDPVARLATVGAGVVTAELQEKVQSLGLFYPPDPSSRKHSTIGGNIACNAGGMRCLKYGVTRDYVVALSGYLADGSPFQWGLPLKKYVSGFNMRDLFIGSEGMLGVVSEAVLRLISQPEGRWTAMFAFESERQALENGVLGLLQNGFQPSIIEFLDRQSVVCAERKLGQPIFTGHGGSALVLIELDGNQALLEDESKRLLEFLEPRVQALRVAPDEASAERLWNVRRTCSQSMFQIANTKLNEDVVVPLDKQTDLLDFTLRLKDEIGLATPTFGHAGDGNLHVHIMYDRDDVDQVARAKKGIRRLMEYVVSLGGVITGEHGVGLAKSTFMDLQHTPAEIAAMRAIKTALDPRGILNPGKVFEPFEVWEHPTVKVKMPWDH